MSLVSRPVLDFELGGASACLEILGLKELIRQLLLDHVEVVHVGLVVLAVVDLHNLSRDHLEIDMDRKVSPSYIYENLTGSKAL